MITNNMKNYVRFLVMRTEASGNVKLPYLAKDISGITTTSWYAKNSEFEYPLGRITNSQTYGGSPNYNGSWLWVGTGTDTPTENDFELTAIDTSVISPVSSLSTTALNEDGTVAIVLTRTFTNVSESTITVNEVGLFKMISTGSSVSKHHLLAREVLDTPITVEAGANFTVSMTVTL